MTAFDSSLSDDRLSELHALATASLSGEASDHQIARLERLVCENDGLCKLYVRYMYISWSLRTWARYPLSDAAAEQNPPRLGFLGSAIHGTVNYVSSGWPLAYLVATVIFGVGLLIGSRIYVSQPEQVARQSVPLPSPLSPLPSIVGQITGIVDCRWERKKGDSPPLCEAPEGPFRQRGTVPLFPLVSLGDKFALASGLMEITYDTGAKVILQGPVTYEVESAAGGYLSVGKLTAKLENKAKDPNPQSPIPNPSLATSHYPLFTVRTPTATVTDLGTEFGVEVQHSGATSASVFRGIIEVQPITRNGRRSQAVRVSENQAVRVEKDSSGAGFVARRLAADSAAFVRVEQLPKLAEDLRLKPFRRWQAYSQELRRDPSLLAYYDFQLEEGKPAVLRNVAANGDKSLDGVVENATWSDGRMRGKHALLFNGPADYVRINLPQKVDDLTLAAWVCVESLHDSLSSLLVSEKWGRKGQLAWQLWPDGHVEFSVNDWREPYFHSKPVFGRTRFNRWTHLALAYDRPAARVAMYVDGQLLDEAHVPQHVPICAGSAWIGQWNPPDYRLGEVRSLHGRIDELAIFGRALKLDEVQRLFDAGKPAGALPSSTAPRTTTTTDN